MESESATSTTSGQEVDAISKMSGRETSKEAPLQINLNVLK